MTFDRPPDPNPRAQRASEIETLRARLRRGDPATDGSEPSADEIRTLRNRVLRTAAASDRPGRPVGVLWSRRPAVAAAVLILALGAALIAGLGARLSGPEERQPAGTTGIGSASREAPGGPTSGATAAARQIHFTTPGGTRIVWVLYRNAESHPSVGDPGGADDGRGTT